MNDAANNSQQPNRGKSSKKRTRRPGTVLAVQIGARGLLSQGEFLGTVMCPVRIYRLRHGALVIEVPTFISAPEMLFDERVDTFLDTESLQKVLLGSSDGTVHCTANFKTTHSAQRHRGKPEGLLESAGGKE